MANIYDRFDAATKSFTACAILRDGHPVGRVVIKFGAAATAFVHLTGSQMASGKASGGGYDKASASVRSAIAKLDRSIDDDMRAALIGTLQDANANEYEGSDWTTVFARAGFTIANVI